MCCHRSHARQWRDSLAVLAWVQNPRKWRKRSPLCEDEIAKWTTKQILNSDFRSYEDKNNRTRISNEAIGLGRQLVPRFLSVVVNYILLCILITLYIRFKVAVRCKFAFPSCVFIRPNKYVKHILHGQSSKLTFLFNTFSIPNYRSSVHFNSAFLLEGYLWLDKCYSC